MATKTNTISLARPDRKAGPGAMRSVSAAYARWAERARIRWELAQMSTRELADLGLNPSDIEDVARGTYRRG